jgi:hypothetical protein
MNAVISSEDYPLLEIPSEMAGVPIRETQEIFNLVKKFSIHQPEYGILISLDKNDVVITVRIVGIGGRDQTTMSICDMVRSAVFDKAQSIIFVHNHPTGDLYPSGNDERFMRDLKGDAEVVGIVLVDSLIISGIGFRSMFPLTEEETVKAKGTRVGYLLFIFSMLETLGDFMRGTGIVLLALFVFTFYYLVSTGEALPALTPEVTFIVLLYPLAWSIGVVGKIGRIVVESLTVFK